MSQRGTEERRQHWEFRRKCRQPTLLQLFTSALLRSALPFGGTTRHRRCLLPCRYY